MSKLFQPTTLPYFAVIFTSTQTPGIDQSAYQKVADRMSELAQQQEGFLGMDHARSSIGITISYWKSEDAIRQWKMHGEHLEAQSQGKTSFYSNFVVHVSEVTRAYSF